MTRYTKNSLKADIEKFNGKFEKRRCIAMTTQDRKTCYKVCTTFGTIRERTYLAGEPIPKGHHSNIDRAKLAYKAAIALEKIVYEEGKPEADKLLDQVEKEIQDVLAKHKADLFFSYEGDSHGIYEEGLYISISVNNREYMREIEV